MDARQYYYTSYVHKASGKAGFQIKAMSEGISPDQQAALARLIEYRIPTSCDVSAIETHPLALRYFYESGREGSGSCMLLCSRSCGSDEHGRPGNFFAHALLLEEEFCRRVPPIAFWQSAYWQGHDPVEREEIISLPTLSVSERAVEFDLERIWRFLAHEKRRDWLYKLLCAVVQSSSGRRIVIIDSAEHVAMWIAAVSYLLPPVYRPLLTFATYHHNPYQAPYLITGTTLDSFFRASSDDYLTYFVLNAQEDRVSSVAASPYASLAVQIALAGSYEQYMPSLFAAYESYLRRAVYTPFGVHGKPGTAIDERLDLFALAVNVQCRQQFENDVMEGSFARLGSAFCELVWRAEGALSREEYMEVIARYLSTGMHIDGMVGAGLSPTPTIPSISHHQPADEATANDHLLLVQTLFPLSQRLKMVEHFWQVYLDGLCEALTRPDTLPRAVEMLDSWFRSSPSVLPYGYVAQHFWLLLSARLRQDGKLLQALQAGATGRSWSASLQVISAQRNPAQALLSQQVITGWQIVSRRWSRVIGRSAADELGEMGKMSKAQALDEGLSQIFASDDIIGQHRLCAQLYTSLTPAHFWSGYWQRVTELLMAHDVERLLALFSFWFDHADEVWKSVPALPQEFFLGAGGMLERTMQVQRIHGIASLLRDRAGNKGMYRWYGLIAPYLGG